MGIDRRKLIAALMAVALGCASGGCAIVRQPVLGSQVPVSIALPKPSNACSEMTRC